MRSIKTRLKLSVSLFLCILFFILSHFTINSLEKGITANNIGTIEKILHKLQNESANLISDIKSVYSDSILPLDNVWSPKLQKKGVSLFVTDTTNNKILFWSDNLPVTAEQLKNVTTTANYTFMGNGWYVAQAYNTGKLKYVTLILIEREYYYQNQFLKDGANKVFNFPKNIIILPLGSDIGIPVKGIDNNPLFIVNSDIPSVSTSTISLLFRWLAIVALCAFIMFLFCNPQLYKKSLWYLLPAFVTLLGLRILLFINSDFFNSDFYLFSPMLYADSEFLPSLGDLLLHTLFFLLFLRILFVAKDSIRQSLSASLVKKVIVYSLFTLFISLFLCALQYVMQSLAFNSEISFKIYKMNDITVYSFVAYFIIALIFTQLCVIIYLSTYLFSSVNKKLHLAIQAVSALLFVIIITGIKYDSVLLVIVYVFLVFLFHKIKTLKLKVSLFVLITITISVYVSFSLILNTTEREHNKRELFAQGLLSERDPVVEMLLKDIEGKLSLDPYVQNILNSDSYNQSDLYGVLTDRYFKGYFQRYDLRYNVCHPGTKLHILYEDKEENCIDFYLKEKENIGIPLSGSSHFWFMNNYWGRIHYFGYFKYINKSDTTFIFLELYSKPEVESIGYPELLKLEKKGIDFELEGYSYAKYSDKKLVTKFGPYDYRFELIPADLRKDGFFTSNGYSHYMYSTEEGNAVVLSLPKIGLYGSASMFSYSFVIFIILLYILLSLSGLKIELATNKNSYRWKISIVMLVGIIGALTTITIAMLAYTIRQSEKKNMETIQNKMQSIIIELDQYLFDRDTITSNFVYELAPTLVRLSNSFYTDLNIYDIEGNLIASSRNEIFEKSLIGSKINRDAYHALAIDKQSKYIHLEHIGEMSYYSSYTTYYNRESEAIAFLNLPYFDNQFEFRNELLSLTGAIMNIYIFLIVIGIALSVFISNQITQPLDLVRRKMAKLSFTEHPEPIDYKGNDELGDLVREYNRMIEELAESAKIMAESERESAWREMARQIAHEIKNPLTPMKLNIQLALRMKEQNRPGWQGKMEEAMTSTLEQIDILSHTASEFSDFARTGKVKLEPINLEHAISSSISLFSGYKNVKINYTEPDKDYFVKANKEQLQRVLTNLIKNSIQATEDIADPEISIALNESNNFYLIKIADNGSGISEQMFKNLFKPNFTTKSGGTGLGLAISKGIIESFGGTINYIPSENGACFEIKLPVLQ